MEYRQGSYADSGWLLPKAAHDSNVKAGRRRACADGAALRRGAKQALLPLGLTLVILAISVLGDYGRQTFRYLGPLTDEHGGGLHYRWISGHLTHLGWRHSWLNLAGLISIWIIYGRLITFRTGLAFIVFCTLGISAGLYLFSPEIEHYVGFSGVLHGLLALCVTVSLTDLKSKGNLPWFRTVRWEEILVFIGLWGKVIYEQMLGAVPMTAAIAGDSVIVNAHLYGACLGTIFALLFIIKHRLAHKN